MEPGQNCNNINDNALIKNNGDYFSKIIIIMNGYCVIVAVEIKKVSSLK